jgi:hypothetical protein
MTSAMSSSPSSRRSGPTRRICKRRPSPNDYHRRSITLATSMWSLRMSAALCRELARSLRRP